jgi:hypothetical protein
MGRSTFSIRLQLLRQRQQQPVPAQWQQPPPATRPTATLAPTPAAPQATPALSAPAILSPQELREGSTAAPTILSATTGEALPAPDTLDPTVSPTTSPRVDTLVPLDETSRYRPVRREPSPLAQALAGADEHRELATLYGALQEPSRAFLDRLPQEAALRSLAILHQHGLTPDQADEELAGYEEHLQNFTDRLSTRSGDRSAPTQRVGLTASFAEDDTRINLRYERTLGVPRQRDESTLVEVGVDVAL